MSLTQQLNAEGQKWIGLPFESPSIEDEEFSKYVKKVEFAFSLTQEEAIASITQAHAMAIGPAFLMTDSFGWTYPPSLQTVSCGTNSPVTMAMEALCHASMEVFAYDFSKYAQVPETDDRNIGDPKRVELAKKYAEVRLERRNSLFPYGTDMTDRTITELLIEAKEVSYGLIGSQDQFRALMEPLEKKGQLLRDFVANGWNGRPIGGKNNHPLFPTCNAVWTVESPDVYSLIKRRAFHHFPGFLYAVSTQKEVEKRETGDLVFWWKDYVHHLHEGCRSSLAMRHYTDSSIYRFTFDGKARQRLINSSSLRKYARPGTEAEAFLASANVQIAKIACLLRPFYEGGSPFNESYVLVAEETYRWYAKCMLSLLDEKVSSSRSDVKKMDVLLEKLRRRGPLSAHELRRTYHKMTASELRNILSEALDRGCVTEWNGKYKVRSVVARS